MTGLPLLHTPRDHARDRDPFAFAELYFDDLLAPARCRPDRVSARAAYQEVICGDTIFVDIRPADQRDSQGELHPSLGALVIDRFVLEWRLDPRSETSLAQASYDARVIVLCQDGYTSSAAAASLRQLGVRGATDVVGGFAAWREAGMPVGGVLRAPRRGAM